MATDISNLCDWENIQQYAYKMSGSNKLLAYVIPVDTTFATNVEYTIKKDNIPNSVYTRSNATVEKFAQALTGTDNTAYNNFNDGFLSLGAAGSYVKLTLTYQGSTISNFIYIYGSGSTPLHTIIIPIYQDTAGKIICSSNSIYGEILWRVIDTNQTPTWQNPTEEAKGYPISNLYADTDYTAFKEGNVLTYSENYSNILRHFLDLSDIYDPDSPYQGGDNPDESPDGDFDYSSDAIPEPDLPTTSVTDSGFVSLYAPTEAQLKQLADYLWSDAFSLDSFKKLFNNPMDCILGLTIIPVNVPTGTAREITVGNIVSTVSCNIVTQQYIKVNCGTFTFSKSQFTGGYLDYSPYTKCYLYLPFIGTQEINIDEFMGATMQVTYHVDILTGAMFAYVIRISGSIKSVIYTFMGQCAENVPLSSTSYSNTIGSILNAGAAIGGVVAAAATGGTAAPVALGLLSTASTATANAASSMKPSIQHSGSVGGGAGIMGVNYPYVIFIAPRTAYDQAQYKYTGLPNNKAVKLSNLSGFTIVQAINLSIDGATQQEINEIEAGLKEGVIL